MTRFSIELIICMSSIDVFVFSCHIEDSPHLFCAFVVVPKASLCALWGLGCGNIFWLDAEQTLECKHWAPIKKSFKAMTKGSWWVKTHPFFFSVIVVPVHQCRQPQTGLCTFPLSSPQLVLPWVASHVNYTFSNYSLGLGRAWSG